VFALAGEINELMSSNMASELEDVAPMETAEDGEISLATVQSDDFNYAIIEPEDVCLMDSVKGEPESLDEAEVSTEQLEEQSFTRVAGSLEELNNLMRHYQKVTACPFTINKRSRLFGSSAGNTATRKRVIITIGVHTLLQKHTLRQGS
jgi:hypothetical protein